MGQANQQLKASQGPVGTWSVSPTSIVPSVSGSTTPGSSSVSGVPGGKLTNTAQYSPDLKQYQNLVNSRYQTLQKTEGQADPNLQFQINQYKSRLSSDTLDPSIAASRSNIMDAATGAQGAMDEMLAARGIANSGVGADLSGRVNEAAQRRAAQAETQLRLGREAQLDALTLGGQGIMSAPGQMSLAKQGQTNSLLLGGQGAYSAPAQLALQQQQLAIQQQQAQQQAQIAQQQLAMQQQAAQAAQQQQQAQNYMNLIGLTPPAPPTSGGGWMGSGASGGGGYLR